MPAVSTMRNCCLCHFRIESTGSRVVPAISLTTMRSSLRSRLTSDDLPTLGRPMIATFVSSGSAGASDLPTARRLTTASSRSPTPVPCSEAIGITGSKPSA